MKRSKIFLGLTTAILAVVGVTAAKSKSAKTRFYYTLTNKSWCIAYGTAPCLTSATSSNLCTVSVGFPAQHVLVFSDGPSVVNGAKNCTNPIKYITE